MKAFSQACFAQDHVTSFILDSPKGSDMLLLLPSSVSNVIASRSAESCVSDCIAVPLLVPAFCHHLGHNVLYSNYLL